MGRWDGEDERKRRLEKQEMLYAIVVVTAYIGLMAVFVIKVLFTG